MIDLFGPTLLERRLEMMDSIEAFPDIQRARMP